jgi:hypothetical protein
MEVESLHALNGRVLIHRAEFTLIVTSTTKLVRCEMPAIWLDAASGRDV